MEQVMTKRDMREFKTEETTVTAQTPVTAVQAPITTPAAPPLPEPLRGDPAMIALPTVIAGAVGLFLTTIGFVPASAGLAAIPVILAATVLGLLISTIWAAMLGQNVVATLYAVFLGFYASYVALQLGIANNWYKIPTDQIGSRLSDLLAGGDRDAHACDLASAGGLYNSARLGRRGARRSARYNLPAVRRDR